MAWNKILGQKRVKEILKDIILRRRIPNAFLFHGNEGVGKDSIAIQLAKTLNCERNFDPETNTFLSEFDTCDECKNCLQFDRLQHPNLKFIFSLPRGKNEKDTDDNPFEKLSNDDLANVKQELLSKAENYYHKIAVSGGTEIRLISIREIRKMLSFSSSNGRYRIVLISNADEMNTESSNSFLKILEEPPGNTLFILTTSKRDNILPTILSRCQDLYFDELSDEDLEYGLKQYYNIPGDRAKVLARLSGGSFQKAVKLLDENYNEARSFIVDFLRLILSSKYTQLFLEIDVLVGEKDRVKIEFKLMLMLLWLRDILLLREDLSEKIINIDQLESISSFSSKLPKADVAGAIIEIENAIQLLNKNVNLQLIFYNLVINLRNHILK